MATVTIPVIKTTADLAIAIARIDKLIDAPAGSHERDELHVLALVVEDYERHHHPLPRVTGRDLLVHSMARHNLTQGEEPEVGAQVKAVPPIHPVEPAAGHNQIFSAIGSTTGGR